MSSAKILSLVKKSEDLIQEASKLNRTLMGDDSDGTDGDEVSNVKGAASRGKKKVPTTHAALNEMCARKGIVVHTTAPIQKGAKRIPRTEVQYVSRKVKVPRTFNSASFDKDFNHDLIMQLLPLMREDDVKVSLDGIEYTLGELTQLWTSVTESYSHKDENKKGRAPKVPKMLWYVLDAGDPEIVAEFIYVENKDGDIVTAGGPNPDKSRTATFDNTLIDEYIAEKKGSLSKNRYANVLQLVIDSQYVFSERINDLVEEHNSQCR